MPKNTDNKPRLFDYGQNYRRDKIAWSTMLLYWLHPPKVITHLHESYDWEIHLFVSTDRYIP
jgi:hypothetical protein